MCVRFKVYHSVCTSKFMTFMHNFDVCCNFFLGRYIELENVSNYTHINWIKVYLSFLFYWYILFYSMAVLL